jgi:hypothetical protein
MANALRWGWVVLAVRLVTWLLSWSLPTGGTGEAFALAYAIGRVMPAASMMALAAIAVFAIFDHPSLRPAAALIVVPVLAMAAFDHLRPPGNWRVSFVVVHCSIHVGQLWLVARWGALRSVAAPRQVMVAWAAAVAIESTLELLFTLDVTPRWAWPLGGTVSSAFGVAAWFLSRDAKQQVPVSRGALIDGLGHLWRSAASALLAVGGVGLMALGVATTEPFFASLGLATTVASLVFAGGASVVGLGRLAQSGSRRVASAATCSVLLTAASGGAINFVVLMGRTHASEAELATATGVARGLAMLNIVVLALTLEWLRADELPSFPRPPVVALVLMVVAPMVGLVSLPPAAQTAVGVAATLGALLTMVLLGRLRTSLEGGPT